MNRLQTVELELLKAFVDICEKLGLKYYLVCGTALGAVKYGGFIPWDDDVDVALPREEYRRFLQEAPALLPEHIFLQIPGHGFVDQRRMRIFLRRSQFRLRQNQIDAGRRLTGVFPYTLPIGRIGRKLIASNNSPFGHIRHLR